MNFPPLTSVEVIDKYAHKLPKKELVRIIREIFLARVNENKESPPAITKQPL